MFGGVRSPSGIYGSGSQDPEWFAKKHRITLIAIGIHSMHEFNLLKKEQLKS
jgi:hypothetical protein